MKAFKLPLVLAGVFCLGISPVLASGGSPRPPEPNPRVEQLEAEVRALNEQLRKCESKQGYLVMTTGMGFLSGIILFAVGFASGMGIRKQLTTKNNENG